MGAAQPQMPAWRTITTRLATRPRRPIVLTVDEGYGGQPQKRTTLTFDRATAAIEKAERSTSLSAGRRVCVRGCALRTPARSMA